MIDGEASAEQPTLDLNLPAPARRQPSKPRANRAKKPSTPRAESAGEALERRVGRLEFAEGAFVRLRVPVRVNAEAGRDVLTDLDVVAIDVDGRLRVSRSILECKSGAGQSGEPDRLLWLAGLRAFMGSPRAVLVRNTVSTRGRYIAQQLGIETMDLNRISEREAAIAWVPDTFAHLGGPECALAERRTDELLKTIGAIPSDLVAFLRHDFLFAPRRILGMLADLSAAIASTPMPPPVGIVIGGHALIALIYAAITDSESLDFVSRAALEARLARAFTVGSPDSNLLEVLEQADAIMAHVVEHIHSSYEANGLNRENVQVPRLRDIVAEPPTWIPRYVDFVEALRANPDIGRELLQTTELACFEALVGGHAHEFQAFDHLFTIEHRQLLRLALRLLEELTGTQLVQALGGLSGVRFDRSAPAVPDRRGLPSRT